MMHKVIASVMHTDIASTINCDNSLYEEVIHDERLCREFIVKQPKPSAVVFILSVIILNLIGYHGEIYAQVSELMTFIKITIKIRP